MQVARNFYLSSEKTFTRKIYEVLLAFKIEHLLTKDQILEIYMNQIYLGQRAYGFAAAAEIYFGKPLKDITIAEAAMLAGLPKAPSAYNPIVNPKRARARASNTSSSACSRTASSRADAARRGQEAGTASTAAPAEIARARRVRRRNGAPAGLRPVRRRGLHARPERLHHDQRGRAGRRLPAPCARASWITSGARSIAARRSFIDLPADAKEARRRASTTRWPSIPDNGDVMAAVVLEAEPEEDRRRAARTASASTIVGDGLKPAPSGLSDKAHAEDQDPPRRRRSA